MKKILALLVSLMLLAGCSQSGGQTPTDTPKPDEGGAATPDTVEETVYYRSLALESAAENSLGAVVYLGYGEESQEGHDWLEGGLYQSLASAQWEAIQSVDLGGDETYLIVPRYDNCTVTITELEMNNDSSQLDETKNEKSFQSPVIITCNPSDLYSNVRVSIQLGDDTVSFSPYFSLMDGSLETDARIPSLLFEKQQ